MTARDKRLTLVAATLGSCVALLDSTVVSIALPAIRDDLGVGWLVAGSIVLGVAVLALFVSWERHGAADPMGGPVGMWGIRDLRRAHLAPREPQLVGSD